MHVVDVKVQRFLQVVTRKRAFPFYGWTMLKRNNDLPGLLG